MSRACLTGADGSISSIFTALAIIHGPAGTGRSRIWPSLPIHLRSPGLLHWIVSASGGITRNAPGAAAGFASVYFRNGGAIANTTRRKYGASPPIVRQPEVSSRDRRQRHAF